MRTSARQRRVQAGQGWGVRWEAHAGAVLAKARTALRCSDARPCGITRYVHFVHCAQTDAASQMTKRAARASPKPCAARRPRNRLPAHPPALPCLHPSLQNYPLPSKVALQPEERSRIALRSIRATGNPPRHERSRSPDANPGIVRHADTSNTPVRSGAVGGRGWGAISGASSSAGLGAGARSALRHLTCGVCLSAVNEVNVASYAAQPRDRAAQSSPRASEDRPSMSPPAPAAHRDAVQDAAANRHA